MNERWLFLSGLLLVVYAGGYGTEVGAQSTEPPPATLSRGLQEALQGIDASGTVNLTEVCRSYLDPARYGEAPEAPRRAVAPDEATGLPAPATPDPDFREAKVSEIIVSLKKPMRLPLSDNDARRFRRLGFVPVRGHPAGRFIVFEHKGQSSDEVSAQNIRALTAIPGVAHIETNCRYPLPVLKSEGSSAPETAAASLLQPCMESQCNADRNGPGLPNDPLFRDGKLWGLDNIAVAKPWQADMTDVDEIKVAIIDSGVDYDHPDLQGNMWINEQESELPDGIDDDGNGFIDDRHGAVFTDGYCEPEGSQICENGPTDSTGHGTFVASIIGARGNNGEGRVGVAWSVKMVPIRIGDANGTFTPDDLALAIYYAAQLGPRTVANVSLDIEEDDSGAVLTEIHLAQNLLIVAAAGGFGVNYTTKPVYPAAFTELNIASVSSIVHPSECDSPNAKRDGLSSFDPIGVDVHAPGQAICGICGAGYCLQSGTSNAAPHLAGAAALVWSQDTFSDKSPVEIKELLMEESRPSTKLKNRSVSEGTLDIGFLGQ